MSIVLRPAAPEDARECGRICYEAFAKISSDHGFPPDLPSPDVATGLLAAMIAHPGVHVVVAERDGRIVGSNGIDERSTIAGIGPITVDPAVQDGGIGRRLMEHVLARAAAERRPGVRLVQAAFHNRSLSLYTKLGFDAREPLSCVQGEPLGAARIPGRTVRPAVAGDRAAMSAVCRGVHGHDRDGEVGDAVAQGTAAVVEHDGRVTGYATTIAFFGHAAGETEDDVRALIAAAPRIGGPGFLVPTRHASLLRWCLGRGLRVVQPMTLMSLGLYTEPRGAFLPSILY